MSPLLLAAMVLATLNVLRIAVFTPGDTFGLVLNVPIVLGGIFWLVQGAARRRA